MNTSVFVKAIYIKRIKEYCLPECYTLQNINKTISSLSFGYVTDDFIRIFPSNNKDFVDDYDHHDGMEEQDACLNIYIYIYIYI